MHTLFKTVLVGAMLALATNAALAADSAAGTWKLNAAKSTFSPGPAPKSQTRTYVESAQGMSLTIKTVAADGKDSAYTITYSYDGKPYAATGSPDFDMVSVTRVDASTVTSIQTKAGKAVGTGTRSVSKDGKTMTFAAKFTDAKGVKHDDMSIFDRQ